MLAKNGGKYILFALAALLLCLFALHAAQRREEAAKPHVLESFRLGTVTRVALYGENAAAEKALAEADKFLREFERIFSVNIASSDISRLNAKAGEWVAVSGECFRLVERARELAELTEGAFNPAIGGVVRLWRTGTPDQRIPERGEIEKALQSCDYRKIESRASEDGRYLRIPRGMELDLGAIAKGRAADMLKEKLREAGVKSAIIDLGGNLDVIGLSPEGRGWRLGLQRPWSPRGEYFGIVEAEDISVVTSGPYERCFEKDGKIYHHIIDPASGFPAESGLSSVTVIDGDSALADALCTALFVMGRDRAAKFLEKNGGVAAVLLSASGKTAFVTPAARKIFRLTDENIALEEIGGGSR